MITEIYSTGLLVMAFFSGAAILLAIINNFSRCISFFVKRIGLPLIRTVNWLFGILRLTIIPVAAMLLLAPDKCNEFFAATPLGESLKVALVIVGVFSLLWSLFGGLRELVTITFWAGIVSVLVIHLMPSYVKSDDGISFKKTAQVKSAAKKLQNVSTLEYVDFEKRDRERLKALMPVHAKSHLGVLDSISSQFDSMRESLLSWLSLDTLGLDMFSGSGGAGLPEAAFFGSAGSKHQFYGFSGGSSGGDSVAKVTEAMHINDLSALNLGSFSEMLSK